MDLKDKVTVWAGLLTLAVLQAQDRVDTELNLYGSDWDGAVVTIVYYVLGFVVVFGVLRWILEQYFKGKPQLQPTPPPPFGPPQKQAILDADSQAHANTRPGNLRRTQPNR